MAYSIYDRVADGQLFGPRFELWGVKLATHAGLAFAGMCVSRRPMLAALLAGPALLACIALRQLWISRRINVLDKLHDLTFALAPVVGALVWERHWLPAVLLTTTCVAAQRALRTHASP